jgi:phosphomannomutase
VSEPAARRDLTAIVKAYDVRGLVGEELDEDVAERLGAAAVPVLLGDGAAAGREGPGSIVVARDMRPSSVGLAAAFARGATSRGADVIDIGLASTDGLYFASGTLGAAGAMFTASHNPASYNGVKLCRAGAAPVSIETGLAELRDLASVGEPPPVPRAGAVSRLDLTDRYAEHVRSFVEPSRLAGLTVVVDAGNGMGGHIWPAVAQGLPITTVPLYFELDGTFPNHPADPLDPANLRDLQAAVVARGADLGLAFDGDADRVMAVDETGRAVSASSVGAIVAERLLAREPGAIVLHNLICSAAVPEAIRAAGGVPERTRVGHSFIKRRMAETDAVFAVEHSGHFYFRDNFRADSGAIAALLLLEALAVAGRPLSEVVAPHAARPSTGELNHRVTDPVAALERVEAAFLDRGRADRLDGLTVELATAWFNLRPSNTEPLLRLNVEAQGEAELRSIRDEVAAILDA